MHLSAATHRVGHQPPAVMTLNIDNETFEYCNVHDNNLTVKEYLAQQRRGPIEVQDYFYFKLSMCCTVQPDHDRMFTFRLRFWLTSSSLVTSPSQGYFLLRLTMVLSAPCTLAELRTHGQEGIYGYRPREVLSTHKGGWMLGFTGDLGIYGATRLGSYLHHHGQSSTSTIPQNIVSQG